MKTLAEFKRRAQVDTRWTIHHNGFNPRTKTIVRVQGNAICFALEETPEAIQAGKDDPHGKATWLHFPKAKDVNFEPDGTMEVWRPEQFHDEDEQYQYTIKESK